MDEVARVMSLIAASNTSRETFVPLGNVGVEESAYTVSVYIFSPGPLEHGGAYAKFAFTLLVPSVPIEVCPAVTDNVVEGMLYTTQYQ